MTRSMTGFGKAICEVDGAVISVELSTVNHRYFDCSLRLPNGWAALESAVKQAIKERVARGKVSASVSREHNRSSGRAIRLDLETARKYIEASKELGEMLDTDERLSLNVLAQLEGVLCEDTDEQDLEETQQGLLKTVSEALDHLDTMRRTEGEVLVADVRRRVGFIREALAAVEERLPELNQFYETRLRDRIRDLGVDVSVTEERIAIEVAVLAEKGDVTEEVVRLKTHLDHLEELLDAEDPVGRRLDFLAQEVQREINTLGAKTRDADVAKFVLVMKAELEKIREQVQNIE